jgi:hypothetical protein
VGGHGVGRYVTETNSETTEGTWPRTHAALDAIAEEHGLLFSPGATTINDKIDELTRMNIKPATT